MSKELVNDETTEICVTLFESLKYRRVIQQLRGPILTHNPPRVDKRGHFNPPTPLFTWTKGIQLYHTKELNKPTTKATLFQSA